MRLAFPNFGRSLLHSRNDVRIGRAATDIAAHIFANVIVAVGVALLHASHCGNDLTWCAVAALERILIDKGLLHRVQFAALGKTLYSRDVSALGRERKRQA